MFLERRIPPPIVALIACVSVSGLAALRPTTVFNLIWLDALGVGLIVLGVLSAFLGLREFKSAKTTHSPIHIEKTQTLVTTGIYTRTRNPMYVGLALVILGWACITGILWGLLPVGVFIVFISRFQIIPEERMLRAKFPDAFAAYAKSVKRWL